MEFFRLGQTVRWQSQAHGSHKVKTGEVVEVVPEGSRPDRARFPTLYKHSGCGSARHGPSYVVKVGSKIYWPRVNSLRPVAQS